MATRGRPAPRIQLSPSERERLVEFRRRRKTAHGLATRARILLEAAKGQSNLATAKKLSVSRATVGKWRHRFARNRLDGLLDEPRSGAPRKITDRKVEEVVRMTLESRPKDATHGSTRSLAKACGLSHRTVARIPRAFSLQPHRTETFKLSRDPLFVDKVRDIVGLSMNPPEHALVWSVGEKSPMQALDRTQRLLPMRPGQIERRTHDDVRHGTTSLFAALEIKTGKGIGECHRRHRTQEFKKFLETIDRAVPADLDIHRILDNYGTHKTPAIRRWFAKRPRYHLHLTPTGASWLNLVERWFAGLTEKRIRRGVFRDVRELEQAAKSYIESNKEDPKPFVWTKTADPILESVARFCSRTLVTGH